MQKNGVTFSPCNCLPSMASGSAGGEGAGKTGGSCKDQMSLGRPWAPPAGSGLKKVAPLLLPPDWPNKDGPRGAMLNWYNSILHSFAVPNCTTLSDWVGPIRVQHWLSHFYFLQQMRKCSPSLTMLQAHLEQSPPRMYRAKIPPRERPRDELPLYLHDKDCHIIPAAKPVRKCMWQKSSPAMFYTAASICAAIL